VDKIGVFPAGTLVQLNTKEIAIVLKDNFHLPLRPVVKVILDSQGNRLSQPKQIDLSRNPMVYIEKCMECVGQVR
ncbi:MAG: HD-GYP domain-containing protein, partial [Candidatus Omnitrophica bacterium]|nr:HD-GYP domain-containing protein [Candidatus Omnitrophota bacterium]